MICPTCNNKDALFLDDKKRCSKCPPMTEAAPDHGAKQRPKDSRLLPLDVCKKRASRRIKKAGAAGLTEIRKCASRKCGKKFTAKKTNVKKFCCEKCCDDEMNERHKERKMK